MPPPTIDHLRKLGAEIERLRKERNIRSVRALAMMADISNQHLSQIVNAYEHPKRGYTIPSDEVIEKIASALDVPPSRFHMLLGRFEDQPYPVFVNPEAVEVAEAYDKLSPYGRKVMRDLLRSLSEAEHLLADEAPQDVQNA